MSNNAETPASVEQAKARVLCDHTSTTTHGTKAEITCNDCGMEWDNRVMDGRVFAIDALIALLADPRQQTAPSPREA